jgi:hypothetical protein
MLMFYYLLDTAICNTYILSEHYQKPKGYKYVRDTYQAFCKAFINELLI